MATLPLDTEGWKPIEFDCMIQDILGNEVYKKCDLATLSDRTIYYCITIPGVNEWVRKTSTNELEAVVNSSNDNNNKSQSQSGSNKNSSTTNNGTSSDVDRISFSLVNYSYPIPSDGKNKSCLIKVYDNNLVDRLRVNDIVRVKGFIEPDQFHDESQLLTNKNSKNEDGVDQDNMGTALLDQLSADHDFEPASDLPHNLVPRIHVTTMKKLSHINPLLPEVLSRDVIDIDRIRLARARLSTIITQLFGGDSLASEYMILSLISGIHRRKDVTSLGQFTIGLSGIKPEMNFLVEKLYEIIAKITTHSHYIDMSIANLNNLCFTPHKDHVNNKMIAGTLQLPDGLYLMLNETALCEGLLTAQGTSNLETLNQIIRWQRHKYDFKFHSVEIDTDLKILVVSQGKSILPVPYTIKLSDDSGIIESMRQACASVNDFLTVELLEMFRYFITALKDVPDYRIPDDVSRSIEQDFVAWRKQEGGSDFSADDLSSYMTLARYLTISRGELVLTHDIWKETVQMEKTRVERLKCK